MEVHHHPHLPHGKRKFGAYFSEFLMIFLAVTMGFLAESLRENIGDKEKEKRYIVSLVNNLKEDTAVIADVIMENTGKAEALEKIMQVPTKDFADTTKRAQLYKLVDRWVGFYSQFKSSDATMEQLKNSGGLRYIEREHSGDSITYYDNQVKIIYAAENMYVNATQLAILATGEVFDKTVHYDTMYYNTKGFTGKTLPLLTTDPAKIKLMLNHIDFEIGATNNYIYNLQLRLPVAIRLIAWLKKEYGLED
jgi:hypothetical protein